MKSTRSVVCNHGNAVNVIHRRWYVIKPKKEHTRLAPWCHTVRKANWLHSANADYIPSLRLGCNQNEKADAFASAFSVLSRGAEKDAHDFIIKILFDQREKGYLFFSLFSLISSLEKSCGRVREKWRVKSEKRMVKSTKRKSRSRDFSFCVSGPKKIHQRIVFESANKTFLFENIIKICI